MKAESCLADKLLLEPEMIKRLIIHVISKKISLLIKQIRNLLSKMLMKRCRIMKLMMRELHVSPQADLKLEFLPRLKLLL